jgi:glycosyltransferase involved in cell wall biosynthesis
MGKKKPKSKNMQPFVSICTPTYNRRPFIKSMIKCFEHQTYPKDKMEWIIIDDGTDKIEDLVGHIPQVKYYKYDEKMVLGKKRNLMHEKSSGDILVYMDDDDYYPPQRVSHAVNMLMTHPKAICAGSSEIYIYFKHIDQMVQFGPYGPKHATAGTFAFKRELLKEHKYNDTAALAEEKSFLKDYTVPFVQLEPLKTILVFSHEHNTFDKKTLLDNRHPQYVKDSDKRVEDFIKEEDLKEFYMNEIEVLLKDYDAGKPEMKPDVLKQIQEIKVEREAMMKKMQQQQMQQQMQNGNQIMGNINGKNVPLNNEQIVNILRQQQETIKQLQGEINNLQNNQRSRIKCDVDGEEKILSNEEIVNIMKKQELSIKELVSKLEEKDELIANLQNS